MQSKKVYKSLPSENGTYPNKIRELALSMGMSVSDLARVMDTAEMTLYDICAGKRLPIFTNERKLEKIFGMPIHEMYPECYEGLKINWTLIPSNDTDQ